MEPAEIVAYLNQTPTVARVSASSRNQALWALVFLYQHVLKQTSYVFDALHGAKPPHHLPMVLAPLDLRAVLDRLEGGSDIRTIQSLLGHKDTRTTMLDTHVVGRGPLGATGPLDRAVVSHHAMPRNPRRRE